MEVNPIDFYSPENRLFAALSQNFAEAGVIDPIALYVILDWKAPRARTRHLARLAKKGGSFTAAVTQIAAGLYAATDPKHKLELLIMSWGFRLPKATAILAVLYPDMFTIYDVRVCERLGAFHRIGDCRWSSNAWIEYQRFLVAVREAAPEGLSLRDCDRWLWGESKRDTLLKELAEPATAG